MRRPAHAKAHAPCPYGQFNWSDCDRESSHRWGMCKSLVQKKNNDPEECSNWAVSEAGLCGQHYASVIERELTAKRIAMAKAAIDVRIEEFMEWTRDHPSVWDRKPRRKGPHRLTELA